MDLVVFAVLTFGFLEAVIVGIPSWRRRQQARHRMVNDFYKPPRRSERNKYQG